MRFLELWALLVLLSACQDKALMLLYIDGRSAQPAVTAPDRVQRLDLKIEKDRETVWTHQFELGGNPGPVNESVVLYPGPFLDETVQASVRAVGNGVELASGQIEIRFLPGQRQDAVLSLSWMPGLCFDADGDGYGYGPGCLGRDCDETSADRHVGAQEICNGLDDDCDEQVDEAEDLIAPSCSRHWGLCLGLTQSCGGQEGWIDCPDSDFGEDFEQVERRCDGLDNDCDGVTDPGCTCTAGATRPCQGESQGLCEPGLQRCETMGANQKWSGTCAGAIRPSPERCNQQDDDCDGQVDEQAACPSCQRDAQCDDDNDCTQDSCVNQHCRFVPVEEGTECSDGLFCTAGDRCDVRGLCVAGVATPCTQECRSRCNENLDICQNDAPGTPCTEDSIFCNGAEVCRQGLCTHQGDPCPGTQCQACNEADGSCLSPVTETCEDGLFCTVGDHCDGGGVCAGGVESPCLDSCMSACDENSRSCQPDNAGVPCADDGVFCNGSEFCDGTGACLPDGVSPCPETECRHCQENNNTCFDPMNTSCEDGNACTYNDLCNGSGHCLAGVFDSDADRDQHINQACGGDDCDDMDPQVPRNGRTDEGPICDTDNSCRDGKDNDCDGLRDAEEAACQVGNYMCLYGPTSPVSLGASGEQISLYIDDAQVKAQDLFCLTAADRDLNATVLFQEDFENNLSQWGVVGGGPSELSSIAQNPATPGQQGLRLCENDRVESVLFPSTGNVRILLSYALDENIGEQEYVFVDYSLDGGVTWYSVNGHGDNAVDQAYKTFNLLLPKEIENKPAVRIRFRSDAGVNTCSFIDDVGLVALPLPTLQREIFANHFEVSEGNAPAPSCSTSIVGFNSSQSAQICIQANAQNPATLGPGQVQGLRYRRSASFISHTFDLARVPDGAAIEYTVYVRPEGLNAGTYATMGFSDGLDNTRLGWVYGSSDMRYLRRGGLLSRQPSASTSSIYLGLPPESATRSGTGATFDDLVLRWTQASHDLTGPFIDNGDGSFTATIQSDLSGATSLICFYDDGSTLRATDGSGLDSLPLPLTFGP